MDSRSAFDEEGGAYPVAESRPTASSRLSVVMPTWNEASWLPRILDQLVDNSVVAEVIVADNGSIDETVEIARSHGCRVVEGGSPAAGRNHGAVHASQDVVAFIDADAAVDHTILELTVAHFKAEPDLVALHFALHPLTDRRLIRLSYKAMNSYFKLLLALGITQGVGSYLAVRRSAFLHHEGFNTQLWVGEDADLLRRLSRIGRVRFITSSYVAVSARRFAIERPFTFIPKIVLWALLRLLDLPWSLFQYKWIPYPQLLADLETEPYREYLRTHREPQEHTWTSLTSPQSNRR
jgi:glycosyltransferase involved in cell wall biosynthesis